MTTECVARLLCCQLDMSPYCSWGALTEQNVHIYHAFSYHWTILKLVSFHFLALKIKLKLKILLLVLILDK